MSGLDSIPITLEWAQTCVDDAFASGKYSHRGRLVRAGDDPGKELLKGLLYQFKMMDEARSGWLLNVYFGLGEVGGDLWSRNARTLVQVSTFSHPALSRIVDGGHIPDPTYDMAYVVSKSAGLTMADVDMDGFAADVMARPRLRGEILEQIRLLADALYQLHSRNILHRNVWPGAVELVKEPSDSDDSLQLRLARFEMSELISNLTRRVVAQDPEETMAKVRQLFLSYGPLALACAPPERIRLLLGVPGDTFEGIHSDVFGLGMLAFHWLVDPGCSAYIRDVFGKPPVTMEDHAGFVAWVEDRIKGSAVHRGLRELLLEMLETEGRKRPTAREVVERIDQYAKDINDKWGAIEERRTYLLSIARDEALAFQDAWHFIELPPTDDAGLLELREFVQRDLANGTMVYSPDGAVPYVRMGDIQGRKIAQYVLLGERAVYFCAPFTPTKSRWVKMGAADALPGALHIRQTVPANRRVLGDLHGAPHKQRLPRVELVDRSSPELETGALRARPSWEPYMRVAESRAETPDAERVTFKEAMEWLLDVEEARSAARRYPFERTGSGRGDTVTLVHREKDDENRILKYPMLYLVSQALGRPRLAEFCQGLDDEKLVLLAEVRGRPDFRGRPQEVEFARTKGQNAIEIRRRDSALRYPVPEKGWLQPADDRWSYMQILRQRDAANELFRSRPDLVEQLLHPHTIVRAASKWKERDAGAGLRGGADEVLVEMLDSQPFFAVQGPPGTGKTTITARAVVAQLRDNPGERILVSAQSHFSLDNMATRILRDVRGSDGAASAPSEPPEGVGGADLDEPAPARPRAPRIDATAIRVISAAAEGKIRASELKACLPQNLAQARLEEIERTCAAMLGSDRGDRTPDVLAIVAEWKDTAAELLLEITDRLRRGANIVFSTCGMATAQQLAGSGEDELFDWVIVEEAAKAWPTELVLPLVRGMRWTLIGDQAQLPAFGRADIEKLLDMCARSKDPELAQHGAAKAEYLRFFDLFDSFFNPRRRAAGDAPARPSPDRAQSSLLRRPVNELSMQFRMPPAIGKIVSSLFYPTPSEKPGEGEGRLRHGPGTESLMHGLQAPRAFAGKNLVWVDTTELLGSHDERPSWRNEAEARFVRELVKSMSPAPPRAPQRDVDEAPADERFAVLTPYREQEERLKLLLPEYHGRIQTVDSFQGKEADVIVVSLVRHNDRETARERLGYLADDRRVNVMLSRARRLLILVGSFEHFAKVVRDQGSEAQDGDPGGHWPRVCRYVESIKGRLWHDEVLKKARPEEGA